MSIIKPFSADDVLVGELCASLALHCGIESATANLFGKAAELHDVGKCKVPENILFKQGSLTPDEFRVVKTHTIWGCSVLKDLQGDFGVMARNICAWHHENFDKCGYWSKSLDEVPPYVPLVTICDVYIALISSNRPYKQPWPHEQAIGYIKEQAGRQFSPALINSFLSMMDETSFQASLEPHSFPLRYNLPNKPRQMQ